MNKDIVKKTIEENLIKMGGKDIVFLEPDDKTMEVVFNCDEITSFVAPTEGWLYTGIQLNPEGGHQYKIKFTKVKEIK